MALSRPPGRRNAPPGGDPTGIRRAALAFLARRDYARVELHGRLCARGFAPAAVDAAIEALGQEGLLNEERYAQNYVAFHAARGQGPVRIAAELRRRGVAESVAAAAIVAGPDWCALARQVCRGRFGAAPPSSWPEKARRARFLQYRGFASDQIRAATGAELDGEVSSP